MLTRRPSKSCIRAYEYLGYIDEREQMWQDAYEQLERAWRLCDRSNPTIGFKLAFCYMKGRLYVEAVDVCQQIIQQHPNYPRVRKEILDKCKLYVR